MKISLSLLLFAFSSGALILAYISQYFFDMHPCILCLYQRMPMFVVVLFSVIAIIFRKKLKFAILLNAICGLALIIGAAIAFYHVGVEYGKFSLTDGCAIGDESDVNSIEELAQILMGKTYVACDEPQFVFLGLSMAAWNFMFSGFIGVLSLIMSYRTYKDVCFVEDYQIKNEAEYNE